MSYYGTICIDLFQARLSSPTSFEEHADQVIPFGATRHKLLDNFITDFRLTGFGVLAAKSADSLLRKSVRVQIFDSNRVHILLQE